MESVWLFGLDIEERGCWSKFDVIKYCSVKILLDGWNVVVMKNLYLIGITNLECGVSEYFYFCLKSGFLTLDSCLYPVNVVTGGIGNAVFAV